MARDLIAYRLEQQLPRGDGEHAESSEAGILLRETCKKTRHMAIRRLLHEIPHLVRKLKPCMLMSPLSIAQYLPADGHQFDVVVFDEASQIATHDAIGAIARGKQVIVVGDSKQLPPTSFFMRQGDDENATPDENDVVEVESILDEAYAKQLPSQMLGWHYRSRHEALINFSNQQYYGGSLHVFPAAQSDVEGLGITLSHVRDGIYESGASARVNRAEAQALVDALVDRLKRYKPDERSFGVVTFSVAQQALVQDLLDERRSAMPEIEAHFTGSEGVFVKNLENVQGDERDEILFSICYAKDAEGKLRMHFGPLSIAGGERRLNVAITRARKQLRVFSTLTADQIDLRRTTSTGAAHLKAFLEYAARKGRPAELEGASSYPTTFEQQMAQVIEACGRTVKTQIGCGGYRIDLAVEGPHRGAFSVAVEGDGRAYAGARSARDRDRLRWELLKGLGWNLHRVWSADWSESRAREEARLIGALQRDETEAPARHLPEPSRDLPLPRREICVAESASMQFNHAPEAFHPNPYQSYEQAAFVGSGSPAEFYSVSGAQLLQTSMLAVIDAEGPVHFELAARRLIERWGIERLTGRPRERIEGIVHHLEHQGHIQRRGDILWPRTVAPTSYLRFRVPSKNGDPRDIQHIATQEIANAAAFVLSRELSIAREELVRATARLFGCARVSRSVSKSVDDAIELLVKTGRCTANDERVSLPS